MKMENILKEIEEEMMRAIAKFPKWSLDPVHGAATVAEEAGEAIQASLDYYYGRAGSHQLKKELIHTATMAIRFLLNFEKSEEWTETFRLYKENKERVEKEVKNGTR